MKFSGFTTFMMYFFILFFVPADVRIIAWVFEAVALGMLLEGLKILKPAIKAARP